MKENRLRESVLTDIVQLLGDKGLFTEVARAIIERAQEYLDVTNLCVIQISEEHKSLIKIAECRREEADDVLIDGMAYDKFLLIADDMRICIHTDDTLDDKIRQQMKEFGIKTSVTIPIYINEGIEMYFAMFDTQNEINPEDMDINFINLVSKVIQSIAQKKVTRNSLIASYEVLRDILSNIGSGIIVCSAQDGSIFFENDIANTSQEVRRTIKECIEKYFGTIHSDREKCASMEHFDALSGLWFEVRFSDLKWIDGSKALVCTTVDITQKKKNQQRIEYQAHNDFLTGLYNRMKCELDLPKEIEKSLRSNKKGAVLFIDLDDFKHINDGLGHQYGDMLLQQIAAGLQAMVNLKDHCYRMGGDEFVIIITKECYSDIDKIVKNIIDMFNKPWYLSATEYYCTMSMGIAIFPDDSTDCNEIIRLADIAMYDSKKSGKNRYCYYDGKGRHNTEKRLDIENSMRQAIASQIDEFVVFYQPVMDVQTNKFVSCEALVRWNSAALGFLGPGDFIPLAEYLGLITSIGEYVLEEACKQCRYWNEHGYPDFRINVNLSVVQLLQKDVVGNIASIMKKTGVNPENIVLEITESFAINDMERVLKIVEGIKKLGPMIALDDFGTGYSSLNYIKQLPFDIIKVDKTFIDDIVEDEYAQAFIRLIVGLSKTLGTKIVVEGVENEQQYRLLKKLGVNYIQGYLFGKPLPSDEFEEVNLKNII